MVSWYDSLGLVRALRGAASVARESKSSASDVVEPEAASVAAGAGHPAADNALPRVLAIANQKGGVGKTTTTINLAACLAEIGYRVLVVDLDPQANATTGLGIDPRSINASMYDVMLRDVPMSECTVDSAMPGLRVAPSSLDLAGADAARGRSPERTGGECTGSERSRRHRSVAGKAGHTGDR